MIFSLKKVILTTKISSIFLLPSFISVSLNKNSLVLGLLAVSMLLLINNVIRIKKNIALVLLIMFLLLLVSSSYSLLTYGEYKPILSLMTMTIIVISSYMFSKSSLNVDYEILSNSFKYFIYLLLFLGYLSFLYTPMILNYDALNKPVFPFYEPSHFSLALGIILVAYSMVGKIKTVVFIIINAILLVFFLPTLTLLMFCSLGVFILTLRSKNFLLVGMMPFILLLYFITQVDYFSSRLAFENSSNLTTLVFLQGWELAYLNYSQNGYTGLGFQMMGDGIMKTGFFTDVLYDIAKIELNFKDGGFLFSKLISELGLLGLVISIVYIFYVIKFLLSIGKTWKTINISNDIAYIQTLKSILLFRGVIIGFSVEFFLRGYGYFSPSIFFIIVAIFYLYSNNKKTKSNILL